MRTDSCSVILNDIEGWLRRKGYGVMLVDTVRSICSEFEVCIIPANEFPKPGETRAVATLQSILEKYGEGHLRMVLSTLQETRGNQGLMIGPVLWATSDLVLACSEWIEKDLSDWFQAWDKIPLGWITWHCQSLYGIVPVRQAVAGSMYMMLRFYSNNKADRDVDFNFVKKTGEEDDTRRFKQVPAEKAIEAGRVLLEVKAALSPREFRAWLQEAAGMTRHAAGRYMAKVKTNLPDEQLPNHRKRTGREMAEIGNECLMMKAKLPRGEFRPWLDTACSVTASTARDYMKIAKLYGDREALLDNVQATGLLLLVNGKTPAAVRSEVETMASVGDYVTRARIEDMIEDMIAMAMSRPQKDKPLLELVA